jgi:hypothetical protein
VFDSPLIAASATFALKPGAWFRRGRLLIKAGEMRGLAFSNLCSDETNYSMHP